MFKKILAAVTLSVMAALPVNARVEEGTRPLIDLLESSGIPVAVNGAECDSGIYNGLYAFQGMRRKIVLCPGETVDANDHAVVRHETWHAIQHCVNVARGTDTDTPIVEDTFRLMAEVQEVLSPSKIRAIQRAYPRDQWLVEFEAFTAQELYTADELAQLFKDVCTFEYASQSTTQTYA